MKKMKKMNLAVIAVLILALLAGCGSQPTAVTEPEAAVVSEAQAEVQPIEGQKELAEPAAVENTTEALEETAEAIPETGAVVVGEIVPAETITEVTQEEPKDETLWAKALENINVRTDAGTGFEKVDKIMAGTIVHLLDKKEAGGYTWYKLDEGRWIANDGTWLDIVTEDQYEQNFLTSSSAMTQDVLDFAKEHASWIDELIHLKFFDTSIYTGGVVWNCRRLSTEMEYRSPFDYYRVTNLPKNAFYGSCWVESECDRWIIYEFAVLKNGTDYEIWDLCVDEKKFIDEAAAAAEACSEVLNTLFNDYEAEVAYCTPNGSSYVKYPPEYGRTYAWEYRDGRDEMLVIFPDVGKAAIADISISNIGRYIFEWVLE